MCGFVCMYVDDAIICVTWEKLKNIYPGLFTVPISWMLIKELIASEQK